MPNGRFNAVEATSAVCSSAAILSTLIRLIIQRNRLWIDDGFAFFSLLSLATQVIAVFLPSDTSYKHLGVARYYLMAITFYTTIWSARLSLLFSIIRIDTNPLRRRCLMLTSFIFIIICFLLIAQLFWVCEVLHGWKLLNSPQCHIGFQVALFQLITDVASDSVLLLAPAVIFRSIRDPWLRYRLIAIFSTCIVTTAVSLVHASYILTAGGIRVVIAALVEDSVSLIVCNLPIVVSAAMHLGERYSTRKVVQSLESFSFRQLHVDANYTTTQTLTD